MPIHIAGTTAPVGRHQQPSTPPLLPTWTTQRLCAAPPARGPLNWVHLLLTHAVSATLLGHFHRRTAQVRTVDLHDNGMTTAAAAAAVSGMLINCTDTDSD